MKFGTPYYLKVDIEGADPLVIQALNNEDLPAYVSFEAGPATVWTLSRLATLGYDRFKCVDQTTHNAPDLLYSNENRWRRWYRQWLMFKWNATRRLALDKTGVAAIWRWIRMPRPVASISAPPSADGTVCWVFPEGSTGPFGEATPGEWQSLEQVLYNWLHRVFGYRNRGTLKADPWYDIHAKRGSERPLHEITNKFISGSPQGPNTVTPNTVTWPENADRQ
jgi:hypothetical protein